MAVPPNYLQPLIGYAMNLLGKEYSAEQVLAYMERHNVYSMLPERDRQQALQYALSNQLAKAQIQVTGLGQTFASLIGKIVPTAENVGVRVFATVEDSAGRPHEIALTLNVPPDWTPADVLALARNQIESGQYQPHTGNQYPTKIVGEPEIIGIYEGGTENANVTVARPA